LLPLVPQGGQRPKSALARVIAIRHIEHPIKKYIFIFVALCSLALLAVSCSSLHRSEDDIRTSLLKKTPIGTTSETVEAYLKEKGWGYRVADGFASPCPGLFVNKNERPDVKQSIGAELGSYRAGVISFSWTHVWGTWLIDTNNQLTGLWIYKQTQASF
jgi:hypothetical protein